MSENLHFIEQWGAWAPLGFLAVFAAASALTIWRLNAMTEYGFQGTALGTLVMPFCSGRSSTSVDGSPKSESFNFFALKLSHP